MRPHPETSGSVIHIEDGSWTKRYRDYCNEAVNTAHALVAKMGAAPFPRYPIIQR
jgi:hypothetical protein